MRNRVRDLVCASQAVSLVLVRAPAGFGKTTTMLQCRAQLEENGVDTAWLTLDSSDNDPTRFLAGLRAAVAQLASGQASMPESSIPAGGKSQGALGDLALDLMEHLAAHNAPFALLLDDFEHVHSPTVLDLVRELIAHLPRRGQLIIGARSRPGTRTGAPARTRAITGDRHRPVAFFRRRDRRIPDPAAPDRAAR